MRKVLTYFLPLMLIFGCDRKPLYFESGDAVMIKPEATGSISDLWNKNWAGCLTYEWNEDINGKIDYSYPPGCNMLIYKDAAPTLSFQISMDEEKLIRVSNTSRYNFVSFNTTPTTRLKEDLSSLYCEKKEYDKSGISEHYTAIEQPGDIFYSNRDLSWFVTNYYDIKEELINGYSYSVYYANMTLKPVSKVYILQVSIINDDGSDFQAKSLKSITISGVSNGINLFTGTYNYGGWYEVVSLDCNPFKRVSEALVSATRMTTFGFNFMDGSSWVSHEDGLVYSQMSIETYSYGVVSGAKDITKQILDNPDGGVIQIKVMNSGLKVGSSGGNFGIDVDDWNEHVVDLWN